MRAIIREPMMMKLIKPLAFTSVVSCLLMFSVAHAATEPQADLIIKDYQRSVALWQSEMKLAPDDVSRRMIAAKRPDSAKYANQLKALLKRDLAKPWALKYGAWLLENDTALKPESQRALLNAVEKHHMKAPELGRFCLAMVRLNDGGEIMPDGVSLRTRGMKILETVKKTHPDSKVQGQAALAISVMLAALGEDPKIMAQRLENIREAVMKSSDVTVEGISVGDMIKDELYKIKNLSKGRNAPDFKGVDSANRIVSLSEYRGKVVMLVFWSSFDQDAKKVISILKEAQDSKAGKPFAVLGVNRDSFRALRGVEAEGSVTWRNISDPKLDIAKQYRISNWPYCLVLDQQGVIKYHGTVGSFATAVVDDLMRGSR